MDLGASVYHNTYAVLRHLKFHWLKERMRKNAFKHLVLKTIPKFTTDKHKLS